MSPSLPATIPAAEVAAVQAAWVVDRTDLGLGLYNPATGEMHVGTFDTTGQRIGHDGLQMTLGIPDVDRPHCRGFVFTAGGQAINQSGFNLPDGTPPTDAGGLFRPGRGRPAAGGVDLTLAWKRRTTDESQRRSAC